MSPGASNRFMSAILLHAAILERDIIKYVICHGKRPGIDAASLY